MRSRLAVLSRRAASRRQPPARSCSATPRSRPGESMGTPDLLRCQETGQ
jgi:hypothetical protein